MERVLKNTLVLVVRIKGINEKDIDHDALLCLFLNGSPLIFSAVDTLSAFHAGSAVKFYAGAFGAQSDHRAF